MSTTAVPTTRVLSADERITAIEDAPCDPDLTAEDEAMLLRRRADLLGLRPSGPCEDAPCCGCCGTDLYGNSDVDPYDTDDGSFYDEHAYL